MPPTNPYAADDWNRDAEGGPPLVGLPRDLPEYTFDAAWTTGWETFRSSYGMVLAVAAINLGAGIGLSVLCAAIDAVAAPVGSVLSWFMQIFVQLPLLAGSLFMIVRIVRGHPARIDDCLSGFRRYGSVIGATLLLYLIMIGVGLLPGAVVAATAMNSGGGLGPGMLAIMIVAILVFAVAMIVVSVRLWFATLITIDPRWGRAGPVEAIRVSWRITAPVGWSLLGLLIVGGLIAMFSLLLLCIGHLLLGQPLNMALQAAAYALIVEPYTRGRCDHCGYDLTGLQVAACPECGGPTSS